MRISDGSSDVGSSDLPVALGERDRRRRLPASRRIGLGLDGILGPAAADRVEPLPLRLHLDAANEQRRIHLDKVETQSHIGTTPPRGREETDHAEGEENLAPNSEERGIGNAYDRTGKN